jgi:hypothetical protein
MYFGIFSWYNFVEALQFTSSIYHEECCIMATQQTGTPPKTRRLGIFPDSIRNFIIVIMIVLFVIFGIIGVIGILRGWNTVFNVLFMIFAVTSAILAILTFWQSNNPNEAPASASHKSRRQYRLKSNISLTIGQKDTTQSTSESLVNNVANIETDKQSFTSAGHQVPQGERPPSPFPNTRPTIAQASSSPVYTGGFPQSANKRSGIKLTHKEQSDLTNALLKVFPNQEDFEIMFERRFERKLNTLVDGSNYWTRVYRLIEWTEAEGRTYDLIRAAHEERPLNPALQSWLQRYEVEEVTPEAQQITPISPGIATPPQDGQALMAEQNRQAAPTLSDLSQQQETGTKHADPPETTPLTTIQQARDDVEKAQSYVQQAGALFTEGKSASPEQIQEARSLISKARQSTGHLHSILKTNTTLPEPLQSNRYRIIAQIKIIYKQIDRLLPDLNKGIKGDYRTLNDALSKIQGLISD